MSDIRIRMYRQGLGDCFLLSFPNAHGAAHVLIDCGVLKGTANATQTMQRVAQNILDTTQGRLDALVVTHEHWDHVSGFLQAEAIFNKIAVREVWLAWTEHPEDELALELAARKKKAHRAIDAAARRLKGAAGFSARALSHRLDGVLDFQGDLVEGRKTTAKAMDWVKNRPGAIIRHCRTTDLPFAVPGVDGVRIYVLGPPHDKKMLRKSDPSKRHSEVYKLAGNGGAENGFYAAVEVLDSETEAGEQPFEHWFRIPAKEADQEPFFAEHYAAGDAWRRIEDDWLGAAGVLALQMDSDTNNTSLALAFELCNSQRVLLFPGDAQVGNWLSWAPLEWQVNDGRGNKKVTTADLLARTVLYKVGHHGSHNATLREQGLELMTSAELAAMIPVDRRTAKKKKWKMPFPSLWRRLQEKTRGRILDLQHGVKQPLPDELAGRPHEWDRFLSRVDVQDDWVDYRVPT